MLPGDPSLPPGVSERDFREGPDNCSECGGEGVVDFSNCCGAELWGNWLQAMRCPECHEACERDLCPSCEGSGTDEPKGDPEAEYWEHKAEILKAESRNGDNGESRN